MNDLTVSPSTNRSGDAGPSPSADAWPWWMAPARLVGRFRPGVRAAAAADAAALRGLPKVAVVVGLPLLVLVLAGIVSASHATSQVAHVSPQVDWLRFQIDDVFTESPLFILCAIAIGAFSPALAVFLVAVFGVMDLAAASSQAGELQPLPGALAGRLIAIWLLWLLAVEMPIFGRQLGLSWKRLAGNRFAVAALTALATGGFVWIWTQAATVLVRPVFTWSALNYSIRLEAIQPIQTGGLVFAVVGGLVAGAVALARGPAGLIHYPVARPAQPAPRGQLAIARRLVGRVVVAALLTVSLGGLISAPLDALVLFAAFAGTRPLARFVADRTILGTVVRSLPPIVRYAVAAALAFVVAQVTVGPLYEFARADPGRMPEFFSIIVAVTIGMFVVQLATTPASREVRRPSTPAANAAVMVVIAGASTLLLLAAPLAVYADNCGSLADCYATPFLTALAATALSMFMAFADKTPEPFSTLAPLVDADTGPKFEKDLKTMIDHVAATKKLADEGIPE